MQILKPPSRTRLLIAGFVAATCLTVGIAVAGPAAGKPDRQAASQPAVVSLDASHGKTWIYFNLARGAQVTPATPEDSTEWDLAFQRHRIKSNGGESGKGGVTVVKLDRQDFDALAVAPATGYVTDSNKPTGNTIGDLHFAFLGDDAWYTYSSEHKLGAKPRVYVVKTTAGRYVKLQMLGYYDAAGTSGHPTFKYAEIEAPKR
jgi:hypothetical protein